MAFSSVPVYLDPPNWQEQSNQRPGAAAVGGKRLLPTPPPSPPPSGGGGGSAGPIKPGLMAERARLAKIPQPEAALKCPRCESTNTKFCYFNNYSLTQPRHFCKTCRRYWTSGGALRNVPVGGGCRRNKRSKRSSRSKSPMKAGSSSCGGLASNNCTTDVMGHILPQPPQLPFWPPSHHLGDYNSSVIGSNFGGIQPPVVDTGSGGEGAEFQMGGTSSRSDTGSLLSSGPVDQQWRLRLQVQQFPFFANLEPPTGLYPFEVGGVDQPRDHVAQLSSKPLGAAITQPSTVNMEENEGLISPKNFMGLSGNDDQYWGGNAWTDLPGFTSSSTSHLL